jgi:DNA-binding response OmpR family regulator
MMAAILFVDDESAIRDMLRMVLKLSGHVPMEAADAEHARKIVQEQKPDLALVDIMMPGEDGFSLAKDLISVSIPVLFLTARTAVADRVRGLRMGAEDYILKPFEPEELLARIDVILRRTKPDIYEEKGIRIDYQSRAVTVDDSPVTLTTTEFDLLALLSQNAGAALSRDRILSAVWGWDFIGETRTVDVHIQRLRAKLGAESTIAALMENEKARQIIEKYLPGFAQNEQAKLAYGMTFKQIGAMLKLPQPVLEGLLAELDQSL